MIQGVVNSRYEGVVRLRLRGPAGVEAEIETVIDTGLSALMALSPGDIALLGLVGVSASYAYLADGSVIRFNVYGAEVLWESMWHAILVSAMGGESLLGMGMLAGHSLRMDIVPGGPVEIASLP